ncbi:TPA: hypothetical protein ACGR4C_004132 [Enterobacter hormaechei]|uniref:Uncharacterized protein n=1 Tax=Enterobacter asburiae TaxID=61645 RepID=A0A217EU36_ENTAS|nr:hypothetical protein [Enterobacter hormaechei]AQZ19821.1 hypothetical protein [Enterobacter asburiae]AZV03678.1 hypothetical protein ELK40_00430 [Enterobacter sp. N18-03635]KAA0898883.1 hypothetical protein EVS72_23810 [Enterobacter hormaechei]MCM7005288.1 hypothetical protein [Enterobacter hormaechei]MCM7015212.1 hypothetical protein [Enterobacter hormaechei]
MRLTRLKTFIRNQAFAIVKDCSADTEARKWTDLLTLKLFYALIFTAVVERVYVTCAITTLSAMSVDRAEQFTLSLLIHYPQYLLWGVLAAIIALIAVNLLVCSWLSLARYLCRKINRADSPAGKNTQAVEVPND